MTFIKNARIVTPESIVDGALVVQDGKIKEVGYTGEIPAEAKVIDANDAFVTPGFVEIHLHGGGGYDFMDATEEAFDGIAAAHRAHGTTTLLPTAVACPPEQMYALFDMYRKLKDKGCVHYAGLHLEGPYISMEQKGAQNPAYVRNPEKAEIDALLERGGDIVKMCTAAPELPGMEYLASEFKKRGIVLSVGHSDAIYADVEKAYNMGFSRFTHLYSNTPTVRKINQVLYAGVREAAYLLDGMDIELIADGCHLAKEVLLLALKVKGADKINLTSDAMRAAGTNVTESFLGAKLPENRVIIEEGVAKLPDRSFFAGSIATGDIMLRWAHKKCGVDLPMAVKMLSLTPARIIGLDNVKGSLEVGKDADLAFWDADFNIQKTVLCKEI